MSYRDKIQNLIRNSPLDIDTDVKIKARIPTSVSSEFITNREQGDWAERLVNSTLNSGAQDYVAIKYGRNENLSAGDEGFREFYESYIEELNEIGKKPDILIFKNTDFRVGQELTDSVISKAIAAIEVRSSSFLVDKYKHFMSSRHKNALRQIKGCKDKILNDKTLSNILKSKDKTIYGFLQNASDENFYSLNFRAPSWHSSKELITLSSYLKTIKDNIKILQKRDYLSITPKLEDITLVNRWIQKYNVKHYYMQVFFDKAYVISFMDILKISSDSAKEGIEFSIEGDVKNQGKRTIKINIDIANLIIDDITLPSHSSQMKELDRGRLLFFVKFDDSKGQLCTTALENLIHA